MIANFLDVAWVKHYGGTYSHLFRKYHTSFTFETCSDTICEYSDEHDTKFDGQIFYEKRTTSQPVKSQPARSI